LKYDILHENSFDSGGFLPVFDTFFILLLIFILQIPEETILKSLSLVTLSTLVHLPEEEGRRHLHRPPPPAPAAARPSMNRKAPCLLCAACAMLQGSLSSARTSQQKIRIWDHEQSIIQAADEP